MTHYDSILSDTENKMTHQKFVVTHGNIHSDFVDDLTPGKPYQVFDTLFENILTIMTDAGNDMNILIGNDDKQCGFLEDGSKWELVVEDDI